MATSVNLKRCIWEIKEGSYMHHKDTEWPIQWEKQVTSLIVRYAKNQHLYQNWEQLNPKISSNISFH